jgi:hypothetical protein
MDFDEAMRRVSKIKPVRKSERSAVEIQRVSPKSHETVMYCSPHPAALHIAPDARLRGVCLYDFAHGESLYEVSPHEGVGKNSAGETFRLPADLFLPNLHDRREEIRCG